MHMTAPMCLSGKFQFEYSSLVRGLPRTEQASKFEGFVAGRRWSARRWSGPPSRCATWSSFRSILNKKICPSLCFFVSFVFFVQWKATRKYSKLICGPPPSRRRLRRSTGMWQTTGGLTFL